MPLAPSPMKSAVRLSFLKSLWCSSPCRTEEPFSFSLRQRLKAICQAKRNKPPKKKRSKSTLQEDSNNTPESPAPRRITGTTNGLTMRQQMRAVKQFQAYKLKIERKAKPLAKTAFTKLKPDKGSEEEAAAREARRKSKTTLSVQNFYGPNGEWNPPVLLVDGYNMCGFWPKLSKHFHRGDLEEARTRLLNELANYSQYRGIKTICVFDANGGPTEGTTIEIICECLSVVFYADCTADTWIETQSNELLTADDAPPYLIVASNDLECIRVSNAFGARILTCKLLIQEINTARKEISALSVARDRHSRKGARILDRVDSHTSENLAALRMSLFEEEVKRAEAAARAGGSTEELLDEEVI